VRDRRSRDQGKVSLEKACDGCKVRAGVYGEDGILGPFGSDGTDEEAGDVVFVGPAA